MARIARILVASIAYAVAMSPSVASPSLVLLGELGPEYDSNATRVSELADPRGSSLMRMELDGTLGLQLSSDDLLRLNYGAGGKVFFSEPTANEFVQRANLNLQHHWREDASRMSASVAAYYYDAFQDLSTRDFRQGGGTLRWMYRSLPGAWQTLAQVDYRYLQFKPDPRFNFHGPRVTIRFDKTLSRAVPSGGAQWRVGGSYGIALRTYEGDALPNPEFFNAATASRLDIDQLPSVHVDYAGDVLFSVWYGLNINSSNSYGESFTRHLVGMNFTAPVFWEIYLSARGVIQLSHFWDNLFGQLPDLTFADMDNENRSSLIVYLARDLTSFMTLSCRYRLHLAETASTADGQRIPGFLRQTFYFGIKFRYENSP